MNEKTLLGELSTVKELWNGTHNLKSDDSAEAMTGPFKWDLVNAVKEHGFLSPSAAPCKLTEHDCKNCLLG